MTTNLTPITRTLNIARYIAAGLLLITALILTLLPAHTPPPSDASPPAQALEGGWLSYANGDDIQALALAGHTLWAGTRAGGAVHWNLSNGGYTQYLHPQTGLTCNDVRDVAVDEAGNAWFATCRGLSTLAPDGTWQTFTVDNTGGGLPSNNTTAIAIGPAGDLWVGAGQNWNGNTFEGGGLTRFEQATGEWQTFTPPTSPAVVDVVVDSSGKVWVATQPFITWVPPSGDEPGYWGRRGGGLAVWDGSTWQSYTSDSNVADSITALAVDGASNVWIGTEGNGAFAFTAQGRVHFRAGRGGLADGYISAIGLGPANQIWFATQKFNGRGTGISVLDPGSNISDTSDDNWQHYTVEDGLAANLITAIARNDERLWLGTSSSNGGGHGISRFDATGFHPPLLTRTANLAGNQIIGVAEAPDGRLWVGTAHNGVSVLDQDRRTWTTYTKENTDPDGRPPWTGLRGNTVSNIDFDSRGRVWIGTRRTTYNIQLRSFEDGGLSMFDPAQGQWTTFTQLNTDDDRREPWRGLRSDEVSAVAVDWNGRIWVGSGSLQSFTGEGISVLDVAGTPSNPDDDSWIHYDIFDRVPSNNITGILVDQERQLIWVATAPFWRNGVRTGGGIGRFDGAAWTRWDSDDGLVAAENEIRSIALGPNGDVWAGGWTYQGSFHWPTGMGVDAVVNHFDGTSWQMREIWEDDGYVASLAVTVDGVVWAGTSKSGRGTAPATGGVKRLSEDGWITLTTDNSDIVGNEIHAITQDGAGDVWFGSRISGLSRYSQDLPVEPTSTPRPSATSTPTSTLTPEAPIAHVRQMYLPLLLVEYVSSRPAATPTPTTSPTLPVSATPSTGPTDTATSTPAPDTTPTPTLTLKPDTTPTATVTASRTSTSTPEASRTPTATVLQPSPTATATRPRPTVSPSPTPKPLPAGEWVPIIDVPPVDLFDVFFAEGQDLSSELGIWAVGEQGVILHSTDGGDYWTFQESQTEETLRSVYFLDQQTGWIVGDNGTIRHTANGGQTWQPQNSPVSGEALVAVAMTSSTDGWVLGADGAVLRWDGTRWDLRASTGYKFTALSLSTDDDSWATTAEADTIGRIVRLTDGRWVSSATFQGLHDIHVPASGQGWAVGSRGTVAHQLAGRWEYVSRPPTGGQALYAVHSLGPDRAWAMGAAGFVFLYDQDHWENMTDSRVTRQTIHAVRMTADGRQGWAVGEAGVDSGTILHLRSAP